MTTTLTAGQEIKVVKVQNSTITAWYPDQGGNYTVDAAHAGNKTIYFKSTYNSDWSAFGGHIWISTAYEDGYYLIKNGWTVDYNDFTNGKFTVNPNGTVSDVKVLRGVDPSLDKEAVRVIQSSPKWTPGKQRDRAVKVTYQFPVIFQLR